MVGMRTKYLPIPPDRNACTCMGNADSSISFNCLEFVDSHVCSHPIVLHCDNRLIVEFLSKEGFRSSQIVGIMHEIYCHPVLPAQQVQGIQGRELQIL
jgi:hypothetical protein